MAKSRPLTPEQALDPRARPSIEELFHLLHDVNPTDRQLPAAEHTRRYALKARLQSVLIRHYHHALIIEPADEGVVVLRHRLGDRDFCHAIVAELEDEARRWVDEQASEAAGGARRARRLGSTLGSAGPDTRPATGPRGSGMGARDVLAQARSAIADYDYEEARALLDAEVRRGNLAAVGLLGELLVDLLADDEAALALEPHASDDPDLRGRLALAAARLGDARRAGRLLVRATPTLAAEAHVVLARAAVQAGRLDEAAAHLSLGRDADATCPELGAVAHAIAQARRASIPALEGELHALIASDAHAAAEALAERLVDLDPQHVIARSVLRAQAQRRHQNTERALLAEADGADARGDLLALERPELRVDGESAWIAGRLPYLLHLAFDGTVLGWWDFSDRYPVATRHLRDFHTIRVCPRARTAWLSELRAGADDLLLWNVVDLDSGRTLRQHRDLGDVDVLSDVPGVVCAVRPGQGLALFDAHGAPLPGWKEGRVHQGRAFAVHPTRSIPVVGQGDSGLVGIIDPTLAVDSASMPQSWVELWTEAPRCDAHALEGSDFRWDASVRTGRERGLTAITLTGRDARLLVLGPEDGELTERWGAAAGLPIHLVGDADSQHVYALYQARNGLRLCPLGPTLEALDDDAPRDAAALPRVGPEGCEGVSFHGFKALAAEVGARLADLPREDRPAELARVIAAAPDAESLVALLVAAQALRLWTPTLARDAGDRFPQHGILALCGADAAAGDGDYAGVLHRLNGLSDMPEAARPHRAHLLGVAWWHAGDIAAARRAWRSGVHPGAGCPNAALAELAGAHLGLRETTTPLGQMAWAILDADARLRHGDPAGAVAVLDAPLLWLPVERQSAARRAAAWLKLDVQRGSSAWFRKRAALGVLRERLQNDPEIPTCDVPVPGAWGQDRFEALDSAAAEWLGEPVDYSTQLRGAARADPRKPSGG